MNLCFNLAMVMLSTLRVMPLMCKTVGLLVCKDIRSAQGTQCNLLCGLMRSPTLSAGIV